MHFFLHVLCRLCNRKKRIMVPFFQSSDLMSRSIYTYFRMTLLYSWATYQYYEDPLVFTGKVMKYDIWSWGWVQHSPLSKSIKMAKLSGLHTKSKSTHCFLTKYQKICNKCKTFFLLLQESMYWKLLITSFHQFQIHSPESRNFLIGCSKLNIQVLKSKKHLFIYPKLCPCLTFNQDFSC